ESRTLGITKDFAEAAGPACRKALERAGEVLRSGEYDLVILDEINGAADMGFVSTEEILALIDSRPEGVELALTGRNAKPEVMEAADYVTEMKLVKHPYDRGIKARKGIDF
ncbi:MAG: cob(I)yrinic acid a,c-diamide adenosyltransferase, partial [Abditibacteriota bacterium]|nr:cob(I)yrinic acid a,c-diamide adenosyltransferase [Abditibacteriota bacterium]